MAKKNAKLAPANDVTETPVAAEVAPEAPAAEEAKAAPGPKTRGPRGVDESSKISLLATANPKRAESKAAGVFAQYVDGMTVKEFCDAVGKEATGHLVYDAKHGYISIAGYNPGEIVQPKPKAEKKVKEPKAKKAKAEVVDKSDTEQAAVLAEETQTETMD